MRLNKIFSLTIFYLLITPFIVLILWSFTQTWPAGELLPSEFGFRGWRYILEPHSKVWHSLLVSLSLSGAVTLISLIISIPAGKAIAHYDFVGKSLVETLILAPIIVPPIAVGMGIHLSFIKYGLADSFLGVLLIHLTVTLPYSVRIFISVFKAAGTKWDEQGRTLKANWWARFRYITWYLIKPGLVTGSALVFNVSFSQYFLTFLIGGGKVITLPLILFPFINSGDRVIASSLSLIFILSSLFFMIIAEKCIEDNQRQSEFYYL
ncbi:MAG: ABC transporter permease [Gracilibacter sp. BRH_c7a]|nr:MAG: ABC transporter permease [Gracilibacter sp. BRH_c7a]